MVFCSECGATSMHLSSEPLEGIFKGEIFTVSGLEYYVCDNCGEVVMSLDMADKQAKDLARQYKALHQIPSKDKIKRL